MIEGDPPTIFYTQKEATEQAIIECRPNVMKIKMSKDAVIRLHNGNGGYIEEETVVWTNPNI